MDDAGLGDDDTGYLPRARALRIFGALLIAFVGSVVAGLVIIGEGAAGAH